MALKVAVIGGGAAGLMAAITAGKEHSVTVYEKNQRPARKVMITGKGRCNVTNNCDRDTFLSNVIRGKKFLYSAYNALSTEDVMNFFEERGVPLKTERGNRVFPQSDKAVDIVDALVNTAKKCAKIENKKVASIKCENGSVCGVVFEDGSYECFDKVILATGGKTYPVTGSDGDGYRMAVELGHTITTLRPGLVPVMTNENFCSRLCGLSLKNVTLTVTKQGAKKPIYTELGEMMFTDFGITGPLVLSASSYMDNVGEEEYTLTVDLKPALDLETLDKRLQRDFAAEPNRDFINSLDALLPKRLVSVIVANSGIDPRKKVNSITREERRRLASEIKSLKMTAFRLRPIEEGIITVGGISLREIDPATMQSKLVDGLYFAGEIMDIDALTGGFNLQIAFSTGYLAGISV